MKTLLIAAIFVTLVVAVMADSCSTNEHCSDDNNMCPEGWEAVCQDDICQCVEPNGNDCRENKDCTAHCQGFGHCLSDKCYCSPMN